MFFQLDVLSPSWDRTFVFSTGGEVLTKNNTRLVRFDELRGDGPHHNESRPAKQVDNGGHIEPADAGGEGVYEAGRYFAHPRNGAYEAVVHLEHPAEHRQGDHSTWKESIDVSREM
jgi:hypothetical protein